MDSSGTVVGGTSARPKCVCSARRQWRLAEVPDGKFDGPVESSIQRTGKGIRSQLVVLCLHLRCRIRVLLKRAREKCSVVD